MSDSFIDSNVLLYLFDATDERKRDQARRLVAESIRDGSGAISFQVVQEVLNGVTTKFVRNANSAVARSILEEILLPLWQVMPSQLLYEQAFDIRNRYRYSFYDSLIIAAALECGATRLYSEDMQAGQRIERLTIENPFAPA